MEPLHFSTHQRIPLEAYAIMARIRLAQGDLTGAQELMARAVEVAQAAAMKWAAPRVAAYQARAWLAQGELERAQQWLHTARLRLDDELTSQREYEQITLARVLIALTLADQALPFLARLAEAAEHAGRFRSLLEIWLLSAQARQKQGETAEALALLHKALVLAEPGGYLRSFVDEGSALANLLRRLDVRDGAVRAFRDRLLAAFGECQPSTLTQSPLAGRQPQLAEALSLREVEVLRLMEAGLSNAEIAQALVIALSTVKRHVHNIYGKLAVGSRTAAVARARAFDLL